MYTYYYNTHGNYRIISISYDLILVCLLNKTFCRTVNASLDNIRITIIGTVIQVGNHV